MKIVQYFDGHIVINLFGLMIRIKKKGKFVCPEVHEWGCSAPTRFSNLQGEASQVEKLPSPLERAPIIVSLTSFPERINIVVKTIKTLLTQTMKPDMVILWLAPEQFPNKENDLPKELLDLREFGLTIDWYKDIRSYKKIIPALKKYPDSIIITTDDDIYYAPDTVESLYKSYLKHPNEIQAHRCDWLRIGVNIKKTCKPNTNAKPVGTSLQPSLQGEGAQIITWAKTRELYKDKHKDEASFRHRLTGYGGVLYPPNSLYKDVLDEEKIAKTIPTHDDIWLWAMAVLAGTKTRLVKGYSESINYVEDSQQFGLCKINKKGVGMGLGEAYDIILKEYPQIIDILKNAC